jgi:hypothetical protein
MISEPSAAASGRAFKREATMFDDTRITDPVALAKYAQAAREIYVDAVRHIAHHVRHRKNVK